jgi:hypothetical protein
VISADLSGRFTGQLVVIEPLSLGHEPGLLRAARDGEVFTWLPRS